MIPILELMWRLIFILVSMSEHIHRHNRATDSIWVKQNINYYIYDMFCMSVTVYSTGIN